MPSLKKPKPEIITSRRASQLAREYLDWDAQRKELNRQAKALETKQKPHKKALIQFVDANKRGKVRSVEVGKFRLSITQKKKQFNALAALVAKLGEAAVEKLKAAWDETYDALQIDTK